MHCIITLRMSSLFSFINRLFESADLKRSFVRFAFRRNITMEDEREGERSGSIGKHISGSTSLHERQSSALADDFTGKVFVERAH